MGEPFFKLLKIAQASTTTNMTTLLAVSKLEILAGEDNSGEPVFDLRTFLKIPDSLEDINTTRIGARESIKNEGEEEIMPWSETVPV